ncbi:MAG: OsmC family protein [Pseudomonadota bacterium]
MPDSSVETKRFDVVFDCQAHSTGKMRNDITVRMVEPFVESFEMATDEGPFHGGDSSAPPPLAYFTAGLAGCIMTQLRAFAKRLRIPIDGVKVAARLHWEGEQVGRDPYVTAPVGFSLDIELDTEVSVDDQLKLIAAAKKGCFIEQTLARTNTVDHRLKVGDDWIEA